MSTFNPCTFQEQQQGRLRTLAQDERQCRSYLTLAGETVEMFHYLTQMRTSKPSSCLGCVVFETMGREKMPTRRMTMAMGETTKTMGQGPPGAVAVVSLASLAQPDPILSTSTTLIQPNITSMTSMAPPVQPTMQTISAPAPVIAVPAAITVQGVQVR